MHQPNAGPAWTKGPQIALRKQLRHPGELPWLIISAVVGLLGYIVMIVALVGWALGEAKADDNSYIAQLVLLLALSPFLVYAARALLYANLRASSVRMSPTQFPEGYRMVVEAAMAAGLEKVPDAYVTSGSGVINAFASGHGFRRTVTVHSDLFEVGGQARDPDALRFVIAHEVGHLAAGHVSYLRIVALTVIRQLPILGLFISRAQEYTADNYGYHICPQGARGAIRLLSGGKYLNANVNFEEFCDRADTEGGLWLILANLQSSHPILIWRAQALRDRSRPGPLLVQRRGFARYGAPALPSGGEFQRHYPSPAEALAFLDAHPSRGPEQFGRNFPAPLPGHEIARADQTDYGAATLRAGWQAASAPGPQSQPPHQPGGWTQGPGRGHDPWGGPRP